MEFIFRPSLASYHDFYFDDYVFVWLSPDSVTATLQNCAVIIHISYWVQSSTFCIGNEYLRILKISNMGYNQIIRISICSFQFSLFMVQVPCKKYKKVPFHDVSGHKSFLITQTKNGAKWSKMATHISLMRLLVKSNLQKFANYIIDTLLQYTVDIPKFNNGASM